MHSCCDELLTNYEYLKDAMQLVLRLGSGLAVLGLPGTYLTHCVADCPSHQLPSSTALPHNPIVPSDF